MNHSTQVAASRGTLSPPVQFFTLWTKPIVAVWLWPASTCCSGFCLMWHPHLVQGSPHHQAIATGLGEENNQRLKREVWRCKGLFGCALSNIKVKNTAWTVCWVWLGLNHENVIFILLFNHCHIQILAQIDWYLKKDCHYQYVLGEKNKTNQITTTKLPVFQWLHFPRGKEKVVEPKESLTASVPRSGLAEECPASLSWGRRDRQCQVSGLRSTNAPAFWGRSTGFRFRGASFSLSLPMVDWGVSRLPKCPVLSQPARWQGWTCSSSSHSQNHLLNEHLCALIHPHGCRQTHHVSAHRQPHPSRPLPSSFSSLLPCCCVSGTRPAAMAVAVFQPRARGKVPPPGVRPSRRRLSGGGGRTEPWDAGAAARGCAAARFKHERGHRCLYNSPCWFCFVRLTGSCGEVVC